MKTLAIIPARYESTRFPGKLLALLGDKPVLKWVWERASATESVDKVIIATDHQKIFDAATAWGADVMMTRIEHQTGTDRCIEVAKKFPEFETVINVQGDEPFLDPQEINGLAQLIQGSNSFEVATLCIKLQSEEAINNPNVVKLVRAGNRAHFFSRAPIPFLRDKGKTLKVTDHDYYQHIGVYAFKRKSLLGISKMPLGNWEQMEKLEQLRWMEAGYTFGVIEVTKKSIGIDTPEDLKAAERMLK